MDGVGRVLTSSAGSLWLAVLVAGCAATYRPPTVFQPVATATTHEFFSNGVPIAVVQGDSCAMLLAAEPTRIGTLQYLRLWWLYANQGRAPVLVEPLADISVVSRSRTSGEEQRVGVEPPSLILQRIRSEAATREIAAVIGGTLESAAATLDDSREAAVHDRQRARDRTDEELAQARLACALYGESVNNGVLRRNTVLPGQGVHGYVYVPWLTAPDRTSLSQLSQANVPLPSAETEHRVVIRVGAYADSVLFTPGVGE